MRLGITGIGGFIGLRIAEVALSRGYTVTGLEWSSDGCRKASALGVEVQQGDVRDRATVHRSFAGCDAIIHTAALVVEGGNLDEVRSVNVGGTVQVMAAAKTHGIRRVVHLSSVMVYGFSFPDNVTEDGPFRGEGNPYCQTKIESEAVVTAASGAIERVIFRPGDVYGPGSIPWIVRPLGLAKKSPLLVPDKTSLINPLHVDHLATACVDACEPNSPARGTYNLVDDVALPFYNYFGRLARAVNQRVYAVPAPALKRIFKVARRAPGSLRLDVDPGAVDFLRRPGRYSGARARRELGFQPTRHFHDALDEAIAAHI